MLPSWLPVLDKADKVVGMALLYYDNFLITSTDAHTLQAIRSRFELNCKRFAVEVKGSFYLGKKALEAGDDISSVDGNWEPSHRQ